MISRREALALPAAALLTAGVRQPFAWALAADDDPTRAFTGDRKPTDVRLGPPKTLNDYFPFIVPKTKEAWEKRRKELREQLLVATGLWPMPEKPELKATIHGKIECDGYTIEKVFFVSMPGHYVCGNLYRPTGKPAREGKRPGVLFAHGHWSGGRFHDDGEKAAKASVESGGEPDMDRGRYFMQALPATLAKLGFVVFHYDMIGYADSTAIPHREGFKDAEAELRLQSQMGLQTWNSIRALDFLSSLDDVDAASIGMTGASGGGTQTFMLAAIDDRLACAFPAVMVSTGMQGGCVCENCALLRVNTGNVEIAGLFAPRPMAFSCANDWTKDFLRKGYPELEQLYKLHGVEHRVDAREWLKYDHNYNVHAREFMYFWMRKYLMGDERKVSEPAFKPVVPPKELSVFDEKHPRPKDELNAKDLRAAMSKASDEQMAKLAPKDAESLKEFRRVVGTALRVMVQPETLPQPDEIMMWGGDGNIRFDLPGKLGAMVGEIGHHSMKGESVPHCTLWQGEARGKPCVVWIHPKGKISLWDNKQANPLVKKLIDAKCYVKGIDLFEVGEHVGEKPFSVDKNYAGFTYGYNLSILAQRVRDVLIVVRSLSTCEVPVHLVGWDEFGIVAILAKALAGDAVAKTAADLNNFRFGKIEKADDPMMLPGAVKYGGLGAFLALCAPGEVLVHNHAGTGIGRLAPAAYDAAGAADKLSRKADKLDPAKVVEWLVK